MLTIIKIHNNNYSEGRHFITLRFQPADKRVDDKSCKDDTLLTVCFSLRIPRLRTRLSSPCLLIPRLQTNLSSHCLLSAPILCTTIP